MKIIEKLKNLSEDLNNDNLEIAATKVDCLIDKYSSKKEKKFKAIYLGAFLSKKAKVQLENWWLATTQTPILEQEKMHHMTIKFRPSPEEVLAAPIGELVGLKVDGYALDGNGQAIFVTPIGTHSTNDIPHVTVSVAEGISPVYSNNLLEEGITEVDGPVLEAEVGFFATNGTDTLIKFDFDGTIYEL
tara:strand:- start:722 stop:1285 length:564 start_codon:yes stop_codon:yes gene_type:complete